MVVAKVLLKVRLKRCFDFYFYFYILFNGTSGRLFFAMYTWNAYFSYKLHFHLFTVAFVKGFGDPFWVCMIFVVDHIHHNFLGLLDCHKIIFPAQRTIWKYFNLCRPGYMSLRFDFWFCFVIMQERIAITLNIHSHRLILLSIFNQQNPGYKSCSHYHTW